MYICRHKPLLVVHGLHELKGGGPRLLHVLALSYRVRQHDNQQGEVVMLWDLFCMGVARAARAFSAAAAGRRRGCAALSAARDATDATGQSHRAPQEQGAACDRKSLLCGWVANKWACGDGRAQSAETRVQRDTWACVSIRLILMGWNPQAPCSICFMDMGAQWRLCSWP